MRETKYTTTCDHCKKETTVGYDEWLSLTEVMLTFSGLSDPQKQTVLLIIDGLKYRQIRSIDDTKTETKE